MRYDALGMFWEDRPNKGGRNVTRVMPEIPNTGWVAPREFPNLSQAAALAIDTETYDPELTTIGPGWARGKGELVGVSVATPDHHAWYFPMRHRIEPETNMDPEQVLRWLKDALGTPCPKIGANITYDVGWLREEGVEVKGPLFDVQFAEALLNSETPSVALDSLAHNYLGVGKETSLLYQWCSDYYGGPISDKQRANIYRAPPRLVGPYAEPDALLPMQIMERQWPRLTSRGVAHLFDMECRLIRMMIDMRFRGAPVDLQRATEMYDDLSAKLEDGQREIDNLAGFEVNLNNAGGTLQKAFDHFGLSYPTTAKGNPSFTAQLLKKTNHPLCKLALQQRQWEKLRGTFIKGYILECSTNGRIHTEFHQLRGDENGARSGRFSSSGPNLQNIPIRSDEGKLIRTIFRSEKGRWRKYDYSQIEYRLLAHHAVGPGSEQIRQRYRNDPDTDYHNEAGDLLEAFVRKKMERRPVKDINFGMIYGMGKKELINRLGAEGERIYAAYHQAIPFAKETAQEASRFASSHGFITTFMGRKSDFPYFGPSEFDPEAKPLLLDEALAAYGAVKRMFVHKALNRRLQGGAADVMKKAMLNCYEQGVFDYIGIPALTVHDELDFEDHGEAPESAWQEMVHIMETCVPEVTVPIKVDTGIGDSWGDID